MAKAPGGKDPRSARSKHIVGEMAEREARDDRSERIGTEHLLLALALDDSDTIDDIGHPNEALKRHRANCGTLRATPAILRSQ
jgi:Clp amino terminal domain, pathogenicity island component